MDLHARVVKPPTQLYIPSFIEILLGVSEPLGVEICPFSLLWLLAFTTACTIVQAVKRKNYFNLLFYSMCIMPFFQRFLNKRRKSKKNVKNVKKCRE